jgi:hypothetical protein
VHILFEVVRSSVGVSGGLVARGNGGFVVRCVCWRHTTMSDGWDMGLFFVAADMNIRTLCIARCGAPFPWWGVFC